MEEKLPEFNFAIFAEKVIKKSGLLIYEQEVHPPSPDTPEENSATGLTSEDNSANSPSQSISNSPATNTSGLAPTVSSASLMRPRQESSLSAVKGKVVFNLTEVPIGIPLITENNFIFSRTDESTFLIQGKSYKIDKLQKLADEKYKEAEKEQKKKEKEKKDNNKTAERDVIYISSFEELPIELQKEIKKSGIDTDHLTEKNLEILLNAIRFTKKVIFKLKLSDKSKKEDKKSKKDKKDHAYLPTSPKIPGAALIIIDDKAKNYFKKTQLSGKGGFGRVFFAEQTQPNKQIVAIKKMPHTTEKEKNSNLLEVEFLAACIHPNIVRYLNAFQIKNEVWIIMEYMTGGTLGSAIETYSFTEVEIAYLAREVLRGIQYLHCKFYVHRDLKPSNIMLTGEGNVKLIDFGLCTDISKGTKNSMVGTPAWMPPEMIRYQPHSFPVDIWSFGICMLEVANQGPAIKGNDLYVMYTIGTQGLANTLQKPEKWSEDFKNFINKCLVMDPLERSTADDLLDHPILKQSITRSNMVKIVNNIFLTNALLGLGAF